MIRFSRLWKIYLFYTIVVVAGITLTGFFLEHKLRNTLKTHVKREVLTLAKVIAKAVPETKNVHALDSFCRDYGITAQVRVTLIERDGKVIGDSETESLNLSNHLDRPEVQAAIANGVGDALRYSETLQVDMLYVALLLEARRRVIRLAMPMTDVKIIENQVMGFFAVALYLTPLFTLIISLMFFRYLKSDRDGPP